MTISKRIRERAAEVVLEAITDYARHKLSLSDIIDRILAIPDDEHEQAIRAAVCEEAAQAIDVCHVCECRLIEMHAPYCEDRCSEETVDDDPPLLADRIRALATAPSGWTAIRTDELTKLKQDRLTLLNGDFEECPRCSVPLLEVAPRCWSCDDPLPEDTDG